MGNANNSRHVVGTPGRKASDGGALLGEGIPFDRCAFMNFPFVLQGMSMADDVIIAFGVRTVMRIPMLGVSNAPLNFDILGTVNVPLQKLLHATCPVEVSVPILPRGETLPQVAYVSLTLRASEMVVLQSYRSGSVPVSDARSELSSLHANATAPAKPFAAAQCNHEQML